MYQTILLALYTLCNIACDVAGIDPSAHHSRGMGSQAAFALRAHQPPACFACLQLSDDTARTLHFLPSLLSLVIWAHHSRSLCSQAAIAKEPSELCLFNNERWLLSNMIY